MGQRNSSLTGGVRSLSAQFIAGYNRGTGNDFPRIAYDGATNQVLVEWNDASLHPLGDIWMRAFTRQLQFSGIVRVNDDSDYTLHFLPAISVRNDGTICSSRYDRRLSGPDSALTDYFAECRSSPTGNATDFRVTTGETDWTNTSSLSCRTSVTTPTMRPTEPGRTQLVRRSTRRTPAVRRRTTLSDRS